MSWAALSSLKGLDLSANQLDGDLPAVWGERLSGLQALDLSQNGFAGAIPGSWAGMTSLTGL